MSVKIYNLLWNIRMFWRRNVKRTYVDFGVKAPFLFLNSGDNSA